MKPWSADLDAERGLESACAGGLEVRNPIRVWDAERGLESAMKTSWLLTYLRLTRKPEETLIVPEANA
jgi:hypothetical protein